MSEHFEVYEGASATTLGVFDTKDQETVLEKRFPSELFVWLTMWGRRQRPDDTAIVAFPIGIDATSTIGQIFPAGPDQRYFWTANWQDGEQQADDDIRAGRTKSFSDADELIAWLEEPDE